MELESVTHKLLQKQNRAVQKLEGENAKIAILRWFAESQWDVVTLMSLPCEDFCTSGSESSKVKRLVKLDLTPLTKSAAFATGWKKLRIEGRPQAQHSEQSIELVIQPRPIPAPRRTSSPTTTTTTTTTTNSGGTTTVTTTTSSNEPQVGVAVPCVAKQQCMARIWGKGSGNERCSKISTVGDYCSSHHKKAKNGETPCKLVGGIKQGLWMGRIDTYQDGLFGIPPYKDDAGCIRIIWNSDEMKKIVAEDVSRGTAFNEPKPSQTTLEEWTFAGNSYYIEPDSREIYNRETFEVIGGWRGTRQTGRPYIN